MQNMNKISEEILKLLVRNYFSRVWLFLYIYKSVLQNFKKCVSLAILVRVVNDIILMILR